MNVFRAVVRNWIRALAVQPTAKDFATPVCLPVTIGQDKGPVVVREPTKVNQAEVLVAPVEIKADREAVLVDQAVIKVDRVEVLVAPVVIKADPEAVLVDRAVFKVDRVVALVAPVVIKAGRAADLVAVKMTIDSCARLMAPTTIGATKNGVRLTKNYFAYRNPSMRTANRLPPVKIEPVLARSAILWRLKTNRSRTIVDSAICCGSGDSSSIMTSI
jgi:hypothetical protein